MRHLLYAAMAAYGRGDFDSAQKALRPLVDQGVGAAQINMGVLYELGRGVEQDYVAAYKLYSLASEQGVPEAAKRVERIELKMSAEELERARRDEGDAGS